VLPALGLALLIAAQLTLAGWALWAAGVAARAGARAAAVGREAEPVARRALPAAMRTGARVRDRERVEVRVRVPGLVPGLPRFAVTATSRLSPEGTGG
jgi:hypothetical protein